MAICNIGEIVKKKFPNIDDEMYNYVEGILSGDLQDLETADEVFDAVGNIFIELRGDDHENEIRELCSHLAKVMHGEKESTPEGSNISDGNKKLSAPVHLGNAAAADEENGDEDPGSIWIVKKGDVSTVDKTKLEKAEAKILEKQAKRSGAAAAVVSNSTCAGQGVVATAVQASTKRAMNADASGTNNSKDIHIEDFDVVCGSKVLIKAAELTLVFGRRYGFVGRNGLGKTTLLRMISERQLFVPGHVSILHVEQEVAGDETPALQSVLECDVKLQSLWSEEKELTHRLNQGDQDSNISSRLAQVYSELQHLEADKAPARAAVILSGLGFSSAGQARPTKEFSGGWRMRLALARALFSQPDLLLLDEPTNMLDMKAIIWLENYLQTWASTLLVVSHDRSFLDVVPTDILLLTSQRIETYRGNYERFVETRAERHKNQQKEYESQMAFRAHVQEFIDKFRYNAKRASLVQSKIKMLEKLPEVKAVEKEADVTFKFAEIDKLNPPILRLDELGFGYDKDKPIFKSVDLTVNMESRICIVGDNGAGKTTLLKIILGDLEPTQGLRHCNPALRLGYFSQHHVDQLEMNTHSVNLLHQQFPGQTAEEYRRQLGGFGVSGALALQEVNSLSGGQKSRVAFALMAMKRPHLIILDEPTNHLDVETIEALGKAILKFKGGVVLVSHDERLIRAVCTELWLCSNKTVTSIEGGFDAYRRLVEREMDMGAKQTPGT